MDVVIVKQAPRKIKRELASALGNDITRYIVELVTNADDSYKRISNNGVPDKKKILISLGGDTEKGYCFSVTDNAEGMTAERLKQVFGTYGGDNSGGAELKARGIFGQGASDVLRAAAADHLIAKVETIKDNVASRLTYEMDENYDARINVEELGFNEIELHNFREENCIPENGTKVTFGVPARVKFSQKEIESLPNAICKNASLRYLLNQKDLDVVYKYKNQTRSLSSEQYQFNKMQELSSNSFDLSFDGKKMHCELRTFLNDDKKENGTDIIVRDKNFIVFDNTMFDYKNNVAAKNISGELIIDGLYDTAYEHLNRNDDPDAIINDNRTGFDTKNPFYIALNKTINPFLDQIIRENGKSVKTINLNNNRKFLKALKDINKYIKSEIIDDITGGGGGGDGGDNAPSEGIRFIRNYATITNGKQYDLKLLINSSLVLDNEPIEISCESKCVGVSTSKIRFNKEEADNDLVVKSVVIEGLELTDEEPAILEAKIGNYVTTASIEVIEETIHYPINGLEFYPNSFIFSGKTKHYAKLYVDKSVIPIGSRVYLECDGLTCDDYIEFRNDYLINDNVGELSIRIKGGEVGKNYTLKAVSLGKTAEASISFVEEKEGKKSVNGLISGWKLIDADDMYYQTYYDVHTHEIVINTGNPITKRVLGDIVYKDSEKPAFKTQQTNYICDLFAKEVAIQIVKQKNIKNGDINMDDAESAFDQLSAFVQQQKNKIYTIVHDSMFGGNDNE